MKYFPVAIDFETTNKDPLKAHPVECAMVSSRGSSCFLIKSPIPVPPETSAIHHIIDADLETADTWEESQKEINIALQDAMQLTRSNAILLIAHNAKYEQAILRNTVFSMPVDWVCTYKVGMYTYPTAPTYSNEGLRYWIPLTNLGRSHYQGSHTAEHDATVTLELFNHYLTRLPLEEIIQVSKDPTPYPYMPFGKWRGYGWDKIPKSYLQWMLKQEDMEEDIRAMARKTLTGH